MPMVRDALTSPSSTSHQNEAGASKDPCSSSLSPKSRPRSVADSFSKGGAEVSGLRLFGRLLDSERPTQAVSVQASATSVGEGPSQPAYPFDGNRNTDRLDKGNSNRLTDEQRQEIVNIFIHDPTRSNTSIAQDFPVGSARISSLRRQFSETGNIDAGVRGSRLNAERRQELLDIFANDPDRSDASIAWDFGVSTKAIKDLRRRFGETKNTDARSTANRLTDEHRQEISHIFVSDPDRTNVSIAEDYSVSHATISRIRKQFSRTQNVNKRYKGTKQLTAEQRRSVLHIFINEPARNNASIAREFGVSDTAIWKLRKQFSKTKNLERRRGNRLNAENRQKSSNIGNTNHPTADQEQETERTLVGSSEMASGDRNSKQPASASVESEHERTQRRAGVDSAPPCAEQTTDRTRSAGIRIFGVQLYPEKAAQDSRHNNQT